MGKKYCQKRDHKKFTIHGPHLCPASVFERHAQFVNLLLLCLGRILEESVEEDLHFLSMVGAPKRVKTGLL